MRIQRVVLEHHRDVAVARRHVVDHVAADPDLAVGDLLQPGDHAQRGGLAAAGRADQHDEFLIGDVEVDAFHRLHAAVVGLDDFADRNFSHRFGVPSLICGWLVGWRRSALGRAGGQAGDVVVHQEGVDQDRRQRGQHAGRHDLAPLEHVAADQVADDADGQHHLVGRVEIGQRIEEAAPAHREGEDRRRDDARASRPG